MTHYLLVEEQHKQVFDRKTKTYIKLKEKDTFCEKLFTDYDDLLEDIADGDALRGDVLYVVGVNGDKSWVLDIMKLEDDLADYLQECKDQDDHVRIEADPRNFI